MQRQANGAITASGGCGEVFRNFFHLGRGRFRLRNIVEAFYSQYDPRTVTAVFDAQGYEAAIVRKMAEVFDGFDGPLDRARVDQLYPAFRCRSFFGREISIVGRYGAYFMPFFEMPVVREALRLPLDQKDHGRFEAMLIARLDPKLAAYRSSYGGNFLEDLHWRARVDNISTMMRPTWLRRLSYRIKSRLGAEVEDGHGGLLAPAYLKTVIDLEYPVMRRYFRPERFRDDGLTRRVSTLEYLMQWLGSKVTVA
jgi:asparagine synthase (glutamine-hydrolysing)